MKKRHGKTQTAGKNPTMKHQEENGGLIGLQQTRTKTGLRWAICRGPQWVKQNWCRQWKSRKSNSVKSIWNTRATLSRSFWPRCQWKLLTAKNINRGKKLMDLLISSIGPLRESSFAWLQRADGSNDGGVQIGLLLVVILERRYEVRQGICLMGTGRTLAQSILSVSQYSTCGRFTLGSRDLML